MRHHRSSPGALPRRALGSTLMFGTHCDTVSCKGKPVRHCVRIHVLPNSKSKRTTADSRELCDAPGCLEHFFDLCDTPNTIEAYTYPIGQGA